MAKITIELDTAVGDTLRKALDAILTGVTPVRAATTQELADAYDPNAYKAPAGSTDVVFTEKTGDAELRAALADLSHAMVEKNADAIAEFKGSGDERALTDMDGDRKRGEAAPGHRRRTNAQIESDREWMAQKERAEAALAAMDRGVHREDAAPAASSAAECAISTGEERINPEDAADEAAETAARPAGPPTLEDLRAVVALYIDKFGHAASVKNMKTIIGCAVAECPVDEIPNAIAKVKLALDGGTVITPVSPAAEPETAELFGDKPAAPVTATKADVVAALMAYAAKFDGSQDPEKMPITKEDMPKVFAATFGAGVTGMGSMPDQKPETLGRILTAIQAVTSANTFGRTAK